jgi:hypothetical protein
VSVAESPVGDAGTPAAITSPAETRAALAREIYAAMLPELKISELALMAKAASHRRRRRRKRGFYSCAAPSYRQPPSVISEFVADEAGVLCRQRVTSGETPVLQFERQMQ